jgi:hypothetical protein
MTCYKAPAFLATGSGWSPAVRSYIFSAVKERRATLAFLTQARA